MSPEETESTPLLSEGTSVTSPQFSDGNNAGDQRTHTHLASSYRRPSFVGGGGRGFLLKPNPIPETALRDEEALDCVRDERGLLKTNSIDVPSYGTRSGSSRRSNSVASAIEDVEEEWEEAVKSGRVKTSWKYELGVMTRSSVFLVSYLSR
jgi:hypothetical protein